MAQPVDAALADAARLTAAGRAPAAIEVLRPVIAEHPDHPGAWCNLAAAFLDVGEPQRCLDAAKRAITLGEPAWAHRLASLALTELGRHEEAAISARESARRTPGDWRGYVALAEALAPIAPADALTAARRAVAIAPDEPRTHEVLGATAEKAGEPDAARAAYQDSLRIDPGNDDVRAALTRLGKPHRNGNSNGNGARFGDVPWERVTAWQEAVPDEPDWTLVEPEPEPVREEPGRFSKGPGRKARRPAAAGATRAAAPVAEQSDEVPEPDPAPAVDEPRPEPAAARPRRSRFGRSQRIGLWIAQRRASGWLAAGGFVLMIAGMPSPTRLLAWFSAALAVAVVVVAGMAVFKLPPEIRATPSFLWAQDRLMAVGGALLGLGVALLAGWTLALAFGAGGLGLLTPVVILGLLGFGVGSLGMWRIRRRR
ncbi:tetratricopeptide repeat protein [Actinokineospora guangxiensis]|uniref:Tetratricopeptide repeat protein n=1 Tax=Actinokineospora guangxiensis TaxID=1490288 RepID=A0ABW0ESM8_9PSEU